MPLDMSGDRSKEKSESYDKTEGKVFDKKDMDSMITGVFGYYATSAAGQAIKSETRYSTAILCLAMEKGYVSSRFIMILCRGYKL